MIQLALIIGSVIFFAMAFFTMGFLIGKKNSQTYIVKGDKITLSKPLEEALPTNAKVEIKTPRGYPKGGIRSTFTIDEPSGLVIRPTAAELKKMDEDEITRANKDAVAEVFKNETPPEV